jgi:sugar phosphate permease
MSQASAEIDASTEKPGRNVRIRWYLIALLVIGGIVNYLDRNNLSIANTTIAKEFGLNALQMGLLLSAFSWP